MKKYLIRLADHLDKKGFRKEADYIDLVLKNAAEKTNEIFKQIDADEIFRQIDLDKLTVDDSSDIKEIPYDLRADMVFEAIETMLQEEQTASEIISHIQGHLKFLAFTGGATSFVARDAIKKGWVVESEKDPGYYKIFSYEY